ncbi:MAG: RNA methyltransferase [Patescibacteria group bacterium]|nr:RNA methyltransferase [Patescibacteria group bacterium]
MPKHNPHERVSALPGDRDERIAFIESQRWTDLELVLEAVDDPHNIGAILRTCDAVGIKTVHLVYQNERPPRMKELSSSAMSALKWLEIKKWSSAAECVADLKKRGLAIRVTALAQSGKPQWDFDWCKPSVIVMGNEADGVSQEFIKQSDGIVTIPMRGFVQSLNVSVAAAVVMEEALRQRLTSRDVRV